jgi:hypothetical protein
VDTPSAVRPLAVPPGWLARLKQDHASAHFAWLGALSAFPDPSDDSPACGKAEVRRALQELRHALPIRVPARLAGEVDADQAALFGRRYEGALALIDRQQPDGVAHLLAAGLVLRCAQVLEGPAPLALRVRAVVDFYTTQAALLHHQHRADVAALPELSELVERSPWKPVDDGMLLCRVAGLARSAPVHIHLLRVAQPRVRVADLRGVPGDFAVQVAASGARAGVSGGFFLYSEPDIDAPSLRGDPVGLWVEGGMVLGPPVLCRGSLLAGGNGELALMRLGMSGVTVSVGAACVVVGRDVSWCNRANSDMSPAGLPGVALLGRRVLAVGVGPLAVPLPCG